MESKDRNTNDITLEESFAKLDEVISRLEGRDITLEDSFLTYQRGMELLKECNSKIDIIEKKMKIMNEEGELVDFQ